MIMQKRHRSLNLLANPRLEPTFSSRRMAAHSKPRKSLRHKSRRQRRNAASPPADLRRLPPREERQIASHDDEPKPEDLAKEEVIKPHELEEAVAITEREAEEPTT